MSAPRPTRSLGRGTLGAAVAGAVVGLIAWSSVSPDLVLGLVAVVLLGVAALLGVVHVIIGITRREVPVLSIVAAGVVVAAGIAISAQLPFTLRWAASESAFTEYEAALPSLSDGPDVVVDCPSRLGLFRIKSCYPAHGTFLFTDRTGTFLGDSGFARRQASDPLTISDGDIFVTFTRIGEGWYSFTRAYG